VLFVAPSNAPVGFTGIGMGAGPMARDWSDHIPREIQERDEAFFAFNRQTVPEGVLNPKANPFVVRQLTDSLCAMPTDDQQAMRAQMIETMIADPKAQGIKQYRPRATLAQWFDATHRQNLKLAFQAILVTGLGKDAPLPTASLTAFRAFNAKAKAQWLLSLNPAKMQEGREKLRALDFALAAWLYQRGETALSDTWLQWSTRKIENERKTLQHSALQQQHEADWGTLQIITMLSAVGLAMGLAGLASLRQSLR